ncbi:ubiquitin C-terminal hydrolase [Naviculisporaceae sp. PSN 640]
MAGFLNRFKGGGIANLKSDGNAGPKKKEEPSPELTPLEKLLQGAGPVREDGSDKFFGLENFGNTCYCNSILQALYYSEPFRECVLNYPSPDTMLGNPSKVSVSIRAPVQTNGQAVAGAKDKKGLSNAQALKQRQALNSGTLGPNGQPLRPEDKPDSPEYKKKQAMIKGPVLELAQDNPEAYGMQECTFTGLKDIFTALVESNSRTGVLSPQRFLDIFKRDNEMFRNSMHQDAHEFYGLVLNDVIANVEANAKRMQEKGLANNNSSLVQSVGNALGATSHGTPGTGWVHDIFEGVLTSETRCLTCETASQRDETFLDLSIDLEEHSSVSSCLRKFSAEEMLCERNKFHCDQCGGLQEAEKRMKVKRLPKVLALHLKRFKFSDSYSRLVKLFHRVNYPYELRMFNTTDDAEDPDRIYELYAVVVHIGGNAYHGHYVSVIKTKDRGWLLFDDEMVEPVDKMFVRNFFGDKPGQACAYVLFYQETTWEKLREERDAEGLEEVRLASQQADIALDGDQLHGTTSAPLSKLNSQPTSGAEEEQETLATLNHAKTAPGVITPAPPIPETPGVPTQLETKPATTTTAEKEQVPEPTSATKSKDDIAREKKELKAQEKARKAAEKEQAKLEEKQRLERQAKLREAQKNEQEQISRALKESKLQQALEEKEKRRKDSSADGGENGEHHKSGFLNRASRGSKSMTKKSFAFLGKASGDKDKDKDKSGYKEKDRGGDKSDKSVKSTKSDRSESNAGTVTTSTTTATEAGPSSSSRSHSQGPPQQNGTGNHHLPRAATQPQTPSHPSQSFERPPLPPTPTEKPPLKERFSFGLGRKKSSRFLS